MLKYCKTEHFNIKELVPPGLYNQYKDNETILWGLFDPRALWTLDELRKRYGPTTVNNWPFGGQLTLRGFRPPNTDIGAFLSQHKFGRAFDCNFSDITVEEVREDIISGKFITPYLSTIEMDVSWFHFDVRNTPSTEILKIYP